MNHHHESAIRAMRGVDQPRQNGEVSPLKIKFRRFWRRNKYTVKAVWGLVFLMAFIYAVGQFRQREKMEALDAKARAAATAQQTVQK